MVLGFALHRASTLSAILAYTANGTADIIEILIRLKNGQQEILKAIETAVLCFLVFVQNPLMLRRVKL